MLALWHVYAVAAVYGFLMMIPLAGGPTIVPTLVPREQLPTANALEMLSFTLGGVIGPPLAGLLIARTGAPNVVILDVRNRFESAAGKFENAVACDIGHFRELPDYVPKLGDLKNKTLLMYCTGGIRCEKASALLRRNGFENVFQLHGGILSYQAEFGNEHWQGECFVFDQRMTVRVEEGLVQIGRCAHTGRPSSRFVNCLHDPCHKLFILSEEAESEDPDHKVCPECLASGISFETADYR